MPDASLFRDRQRARERERERERERGGGREKALSGTHQNTSEY
jgi:hypothetical protein